MPGSIPEILDAVVAAHAAGISCAQIGDLLGISGQQRCEAVIGQV